MDNMRKARFHKVMAEHYAHGGNVDGQTVTFGDQDFLSPEGDENMMMGPEHAGSMKLEESEDKGMDMKKKRLHAIRMGK